MVAPNGARRSKADHPNLPLTTTELAETALSCSLAGAGAIHVHVRDNEGRHSLDPMRYFEALSAIHDAAPEIKVQITTESAGIFDVSAQLNCLKHVKPAWASISVREIAREPNLADSIYGCCAEQGTEVQHILYDVSDITLLNKWQHEGIVRTSQNSVIFVLGRYSEGRTSSPADLTPLLNTMPTRSQWMVCAFGPREHECLIEAARLGGNLRVGFENSLQDTDGNIWSDNSASVAALKTQLGK